MLLLAVPLLNPHLGDLEKSIRYNDLTHADSYWNQYTTSLTKERYFSENTQQLAGLNNIKEHEVKFAEEQLTEAEFCHQIGLDFSEDIMPILSKWFLNKAESLGFVDVTTYFARARNYAREWNNNLHYNEDFSDILETQWHEALTQVIKIAKDSVDIYRALFGLTCIYSPARNSLFRDSVAPKVIGNLEKFIDDYPGNPFIEHAYEGLVWWLCITKRYTKLRAVCQEFLKRYHSAEIKEYIKFQLGNAHYFTQNFDEARKIYSSIDQNSFPDRVYPGWGGRYILEIINNRLDELENTG